MSTTLDYPVASIAPVVPTRSPGLAELLSEVGTALEALPVETLEPATLATLTAHLVDGAGSPLTFTPERTTPAIVSLRALGVLAARTADLDIAFPTARAEKVRTLLARLTAA